MREQRNKYFQCPKEGHFEQGVAVFLSVGILSSPPIFIWFMGYTSRLGTFSLAFADRIVFKQGVGGTFGVSVFSDFWFII